MAQAIAERVRSYVLDGSDEDLRRLMKISQLQEESARRALRKAGLCEGGTAIDCGCGPIGGLVVMAEMVGPSGRIVGVDFSEPAIRRARAVVSALKLENVELFAGDIHDQETATLGGPFDLAFSRCFLMHQPDPVRTLRRIADLVRPGGSIVAHEPLLSPPPRSHPQLAAVAGGWELLHEVMELGGAPRGTVDDLPRSARDAGLEVIETNGHFNIGDPVEFFELHAATLAATRERAVKSGIATKKIDDLVAALRAAKDGGYAWVTSPFFFDLSLRKPKQ